MSRVTVEEVTVTRSMARTWLDRNIERNRPPSTSVIDRYARDMDEDRWIQNGDTIKFNVNDEMFDGQQRVKAFLASSRKTIKFLVARGLDPAAVRVTDNGRKRTVAHNLAIDGVPHATIVGSVVRRIICWDRGNYMGQVGRGTNRNAIPSDPEIQATYHLTPADYDTAALRGSDIRTRKLGAPGQAGAAFFLFSRLDKQAAHAFFDIVLAGTGVGESHPAWVLRERLRTKLDPHAQCALWIKAWNFYRLDQPIPSGRLQLPQGPLCNENYPVPE